ncbi:MAG: M48 family metalloprotease [Ignavibacteriales bacterium]|nr:M48 family metalloprotease [Ignavibacteriales bacterium]
MTPLENESLRSKIENLAHKAGMKVQNIYSFNMSKNTKKANAAFTGLGKSKRILLGDNLLDSYTEDEVETVIAHELGHYKKKHIIKNLLIGTFSSFFTLYVIAALYNWSLPWFRFCQHKSNCCATHSFFMGMIIGMLLNPATNIISRKFEYEADEYAIVSTKQSCSFYFCA